MSDLDTGRQLAAEAFNEAWDLLERRNRSADEDDEMLAATLTQRRLWYRFGDQRNRSVAEWQVSRVATVLGYPEMATRAAVRSIAEAEAGRLEPFWLGYAHEARARAALLSQDLDAAATEIERALTLCAVVEESEDRSLLERDLRELSSRLHS